MNVNVEVEFLIRGEDAAALVNRALARLEQLNRGPLPAEVVPTIRGVKPDSLDGADVVQMWAGVCVAMIPRSTDYGTTGEVEVDLARARAGTGFPVDGAPDIAGDRRWQDGG